LGVINAVTICVDFDRVHYAEGLRG
jgi:hypothetical protein